MLRSRDAFPPLRQLFVLWHAENMTGGKQSGSVADSTFMAKRVTLIRRLLHVHARHDWIILFQVHVNSGFGIYDKIGFEKFAQ